MTLKLDRDGNIDLDKYTTEEIYELVDTGQIHEFYPTWFYGNEWWDQQQHDNNTVVSIDLGKSG